MGTAQNGFEEGTDAARVFFPGLVLGWEVLAPVMIRWGHKVPAVFNGTAIIAIVEELQRVDFIGRIASAKVRVSLADLTVAESAEDLAISWMILATWSMRYERNRRAELPTLLEWMEATEALRDLQAAIAAHEPNLNH